MSLSDRGDVAGFAKAAHPLVSVFLYRYVLNKASHLSPCKSSSNCFSLYRLDAGNKEALSCFDKGDIAGFAKAAQPLVSVLLYRSLEFAEHLPRGSADDDYREQDDYFFDSDDDDCYPLDSNDDSWDHHY